MKLQMWAIKKNFGFRLNVLPANSNIELILAGRVVLYRKHQLVQFSVDESSVQIRDSSTYVSSKQKLLKRSGKLVKSQIEKNY